MPKGGPARLQYMSRRVVVGIVGPTREQHPDTKETFEAKIVLARDVGKLLAQSGVVVLSGGALVQNPARVSEAALQEATRRVSILPDNQHRHNWDSNVDRDHIKFQTQLT